MKSMPIRYVRDMDTAQRFYQALGLEVGYNTAPPRHGPVVWVELGERGGLALHHVPPEADEPPLGLSFQADEPLEKVVERLRRAGFEPATAIVDESFGRSFTVRDPEGLLIQVNEHDPDLAPATGSG